jgi:hypothetical protein
MIPDWDCAILHYPYPIALGRVSLQGAQLGFKQGKYLEAGRRFNNSAMPHHSQAYLILGRQSL